MGEFGILDADDFPAGRLTVKNENAGPGKSQPLSQEGPTGGVGSAFHGRCGESNRYPCGKLGHQLILRRTRLDVDGEEDIRAILSDDGWAGSHF